MSPEPSVLLDLDGTLVDSVYVHVVCWHDALAAAGHEVAMWRIHAGIGMGSDRLIPWLLGEQPDGAGELSDDHTRRFLARVDDLRPTNGAIELLDDLESRGVQFTIATSAGEEERKGLLEALGRTDLETTDSSDVSSSKPAPDLLAASAAELGIDPTTATLVGDSPWDARAAAKLGMRTIAVRTGGFGDDVLRESGAVDVVDDPRALIGRL